MAQATDLAAIRGPSQQLGGAQGALLAVPLTVALWAEQVATEHVVALGSAALELAQRIACIGSGVGVLPKLAAARAAFEAFYVIG